MKEFYIVCSNCSSSPEGDDCEFEDRISKLLKDGWKIASSGLTCTGDKYINWAHLVR